MMRTRCFFESISGLKMARSTDTVAGRDHSNGGMVRASAPLCYLGELNGSAHARWQKTVEVFNEQGETTQLKLFPPKQKHRMSRT